MLDIQRKENSHKSCPHYSPRDRREAIMARAERTREKAKGEEVRKITGAGGQMTQIPKGFQL